MRAVRVSFCAVLSDWREKCVSSLYKQLFPFVGKLFPQRNCCVLLHTHARVFICTPLMEYRCRVSPREWLFISIAFGRYTARMKRNVNNGAEALSRRSFSVCVGDKCRGFLWRRFTVHRSGVSKFFFQNLSCSSITFSTRVFV